MGWMCHIKTIKKHFLTMAQSMAHTGFLRVAGKLPVFFPSSDWEARVGWSGVLLEHLVHPGATLRMGSNWVGQ